MITEASQMILGGSSFGHCGLFAPSSEFTVLEIRVLIEKLPRFQHKMMGGRKKKFASSLIYVCLSSKQEGGCWMKKLQR